VSLLIFSESLRCRDKGLPDPFATGTPRRTDRTAEPEAWEPDSRSVGKSEEAEIMLLIRVISYRDRPVDRELSARFGEAGGTIGLGEASTLVLPDPERHISRTHATITFQASGFVITDISTKNPTVLNGRPMGPGAQVRLAD